jgi:methionyl-tRNA synthetase
VCCALLTLFARRSSLASLARAQQEILSFLDQDITDLCVSRTTFDWGIPVPDAPGHVMYVWFDALSNYLSGIGYLEDDAPNADMWPADVHIIGKDITRFHCIYWPCMLMAANIPLPKVVFGHGFVHDSKGKKMSKSVGNVVDPNKILDIYSSDVFRFFLTRQCHYGSDLSCDLGAMVALCESELNDALGNLVNRAVKLSEKYCDNWYDYSTSFPALRGPRTWCYHPSFHVLLSLLISRGLFFQTTTASKWYH